MIKETYNLLIIDKSGSMASIAKQAIAGVNETIATIKKAREETGIKQFVTVTAFCGCGCKDLCHNVLVENAPQITAREYQPCCMTPLYDAIGMTCTRLRKEIEGRDDVAVSVTIITDGYENASREWRLPAVKQLVESLKADGWLIAYIGANQDIDAIKVDLSITNAMAFTADEDGTEKMFADEKAARLRWSRSVKWSASPSAINNDNYFTPVL